MNQRTAGIAGIAAVSLAAIGLLAPAAGASPAPGNLAPGLQCSPSLRCENDANQTYRIDWIGTCGYGLSSAGPVTVPEHTWIAPHETIDLVEGINNAYCPVEPANYPNTGQSDPGSIIAGQYQGAAVDSSHPPAPAAPWSGSASA